jgi:anti-anti-sigma regulatory factor
VAVLCPANLDAEGGDRLRREWLARQQTSTTHLRFDFSAVEEVAPAALAVLALLARTPGPDGAPPRLEIVNAAPAIRRLLSLTRLDSCYTILPGQGE